MSVLPDPGASRAVIIGTSRYDYLEQLPAVSNNLTALAELLSGPMSLRMPASHVTVVENPPDPATVMNPLRQAAAEATDTLIVYYAGHGLIDPYDALTLAMPHTQPDRIETSLNYDWLRQILLNSRAQRHIVLLDCCYSGLALGRMSASQGLADHAAVEGTFLLAASAETRTALAPIGDTHTAFTAALLETLRNGIPGGPPLLDLETVYHHLRLTLKARGHPVPQARNRNSGARVALVRNHAADQGAPPASGVLDDFHRSTPESLRDDAREARLKTLYLRTEHVRALRKSYDLDHREALDLCVALIDELTREVGADQLWTLDVRKEHALLFGVTDRALELWEDLIHDMENALGRDDPHTLLARYERTFSVGCNKGPEQAVALLTILLADCERFLEPGSWTTFITRDALKQWRKQTLIPKQMRSFLPSFYRDTYKGDMESLRGFE